jgi:glyoxylase-like metal-dependent hydrolase (beta-lactamase superfamily II)
VRRVNSPRGELNASSNSSWDEFKMKHIGGRIGRPSGNLPRGKLGSPHLALGRWTLVLAVAVAAAGTRLLVASPVLAGAHDGLPDPYVVVGEGWVLDSSHPMRPGDARRFAVTFRISADDARDEYSLAVRDSGDATSRPDVWYVRGLLVTRADTTGTETVDAPFGDVSAPALAAIDPGFVAGPRVQQWKIDFGLTGLGGMKPRDISRRYFDERLGDGAESIHYELLPGDSAGAVRTTIRRGDTVVGQFDLRRDAHLTPAAIPPPGPAVHDPETRGTIHSLAPGQVTFKEIVPHVFEIDLDSLNTRVVVAEFADSLVVLEGAYGSVVCDALADAIRERFHKPVRMFAFSHLHAQYSGGTRSWVHEGATIVIPPSTEPLIDQMVNAPFTLRPDALARDPKPLHVLTVPKHLHVEDSMDALDIYNVESGHTDEYFLFHFPRQKVLLTGDLMFLRPGKPFGGRSKLLCGTVAKLGLDVDTYVATWPLHGFGTKPIVTRDEFQAACPPTAAAKP